MIVAGFGFRGTATTEALMNALDATGAKPDILATPADKAQSAAFQKLADQLGLPIAAVPADAFEDVTTPTQSAASLAARGTGSVSEACALAVAGANARMVAGRTISSDGMATCAVAEGDS